QLILFIVDYGCTKHMTGNLNLLCNFVEKFLETVRFGNDQFAPIIGYGDLAQGNFTINRVYYVEGLNHNIFSVGQFCDPDLEVAFRKSTCFVRDLQGNDLLIGNRGSDLYIISLQKSTSSTPLCLMAKATPTQAWLWHRRISYLNFDYINLLSKKDIAVPSSKGRLNLLHMDLCGPMRVASMNGKKYILVIVDDYSRYTWTLFLRSKDETPEVLKDFLMMIQRNLQAPMITVRTDRDGKNLDKMKEKGDQCILVGYSTQSKGYRVYNKRTRMIVKSIHIRFDEIKEVSERSVANNTSGLVPQRQKASDYDNPDPVPQREDVASSADADVPSQQELDLLFGPLYDEFFNAGSNPSTNIQSTSAPSTHINVHAEKNNNDQAEEGEQLQDDEFTNPLCAPAQEQAESSSHNIGNSNVPTFNQPQVSEYQWTKDHPLEQVRGNPSRPVKQDNSLLQILKCVYNLRKALYGLKQAPRAWYDELLKFLTSKGLQIHQSPCGIFINQAKYNLEILHKHGMDKGQSIAFLDADHAGCIDSGKSTSGGIQFLGDKVKTKQSSTTLKAEAGSIHMLSVFTKVNSGTEDKTSCTSDALHNPSQPFEFLSTETSLICHGDTHDFYRLSHSELVDIE
nr:retrovirus-related Pol polyprotein from transposon TNT 1-94 [Tanacetum cinerariifolium]